MKIKLLIIIIATLLLGTKAFAQLCFSSSVSYAGTTSPRRIISADFNGDGKADLAVANFSFVPLSNTLSIYLNTGTGSFGAATNYITGSGTSGITAADFNGDGKLDLATANRQSNSVSILLGTGTGSFGAATNYTVATNPQEIISGDFNGDGKLDLAVANSTSGNVSILLGTGTGNFGATTNFIVGSGANDVICKDFNGDGKLDLVLTCAGSSNTVNILLGTGTGSFGTPIAYPVGVPNSVTSGDFNGDGKLDLAVGNSVSGIATVSILLGTGTGSFGAVTNFAVGGFQAYYIINNDFNGDGKIDLATANNDAVNSVSVLLGDGLGNFGLPFFLTTGGASTPVGITSADFNGDTKIDIATANYVTDNISVFLNIDFLTNLAATNGGTQVCKSGSVSAGGTYYIASSCKLIAKVIPSGPSPVSGTINSCVIIDGSVQTLNAEPYVQRHFDIEPVTNPNNSTATITLYFKDQEFVDFNTNRAGFPALPTVAGGGNSDPNIANLKVTQYHGVPIAPHNTGNPAAGYYSGSSLLITPTSVNYNNTNSYWEVAFPVTGFSGFYVHTNVFPLPVSLIYFNGKKQGSGHLLNWKVNCNSLPGVSIVLERSVDSRNFTGIYSILTDASGCLQPFNYLDANPLKGKNYYRLKMITTDGKITYSSLLVLINAENGFDIISLEPNPVINNKFMLNISSTKATPIDIFIYDIQGRLINKQTVNGIAGYNSFNINAGSKSAGTFVITASSGNEKSRSLRFVKK